jgi:hypothetical protein
MNAYLEGKLAKTSKIFYGFLGHSEIYISDEIVEVVRHV